MRTIVLVTTGLFLFGAAFATVAGDKPDLSGTWKLDQARTESGVTNKNLVLLVEQKDQSIHIKETRGSNSKDDVSDFTCGVLGKECAMQDGPEKASVSVYYNGPVLVVLKTNGRKGDSVTKWELSLASAGDSLNVEVMHIDPAAKTEKLVFSKVQ
jgi:hypothetical protein